MASFTYPTWLKPGVKHTLEQKNKAIAASTNWIRLSREFPNLTEKELLVVIVLELNNRKRPEIIGRTRNRFLKVRAQREVEELWAICPGAGIRGA